MKEGIGHVGRILALSGTIFVAACEHDAPSGKIQPVEHPVTDSGTVALLLPYGSDDDNNIELAKNLENGARMAVANLPDIGISLKVYPTGGTAEGAVEAAMLALDDGAGAILGPVFGDAAAAVGPVAAASGVPVFSFSNRTEIAGNNLYLLGHTHRNAANRILQYGREQGKGRVLVVHADTAAGRASQVAVKTAAALQGIELAGSISHEFSQIGVVDSIPEIVGAVNESGADMLVLTGIRPVHFRCLPR